MFLISFKAPGQRIKPLRGASNLTVAKWWVKAELIALALKPDVSEEMRQKIVKNAPDPEWQTDEQGNYFIDGANGRYTIEPLVFVS